MELMRTVRINTKYSLLVQLHDTYTGTAPVGTNISVMLEGINRKPLAKPEGYFVFTDLPEGTYALKVKSKFYLEENSIVTLRESDSEYHALNLSLKPAFSYPYFSGATCCLASLRTTAATHADVRVRATVLDEGCAIARLAQDVLAAGNKEVVLNKHGIIAVGDLFRIQAKEAGTAGYCRIAAINYQKNTFILASPLEHDYKRGDYFLPVMETRSDDRGEVSLYFRRYREKSFKVSLEIFIDDHVIAREVKMEEGKAYNLGVVS